jgi:bacterioferritin
MKGAKEVIAELNRALTNELTAINQYFLHARMYESWGFEKLGKKTYEESIGEMKHADALVKRILLLEGLPNMSDMHKLQVGESVPEGLEGDLAVERRGRECLVKGIETCETKKDFVSRDMLRAILEDTEEHIDFLETQLELIEQMGLQNYLQSQAF